MGISLSKPALVEEGHYLWRIQNFSGITAAKISSEDFDIGGHKWRVLLYPAQLSYVTVYLCSPGSSFLPEWWAPSAEFKFILINQRDPSRNFVKEASHHFTKDVSSSGMSLIPVRDVYMNNRFWRSADYLPWPANTLELRVEIRVHKEYTDRKKATQVKTKGQHVWRIPDYRQTRESKLSSDIFDVGTYKWRLVMEPSEQTGYHTVCLESLGSSFLPRWWAPSALFKLVIVNQRDPSKNSVHEASHPFTSSAFRSPTIFPVGNVLSPSSPYLTRDGALELRVEMQAKVRVPSHIAQSLAGQNGQPSRAQPAQAARDKSTDGLLKLPPIRAQARRDCMVCMEPVLRGAIIYRQRGCTAFLCQGCTNFMCSTRADSSGQDGCNNGELMCTTCTPHHPISPATLARTVPVQVFKRLQAKLSREPLCGSWKMFVMRTCPDCNNTAAVAAGQPFYMCTSLQCSTKSNLFCMFCDAPWAFGHTCAPPINMGTVKEMLHTEAAAANDQLQNLLVRPCPRCPVRICTIDPHMCYHVTCGTCRLQYCGICPFVKLGGSWLHQCVDSNNIYKRSEPRRKAVLNAYEEALD